MAKNIRNWKRLSFGEIYYLRKVAQCRKEMKQSCNCPRDSNPRPDARYPVTLSR